jgi:pimeloyl-ACP methyl ester carboxylesterase
VPKIDLTKAYAKNKDGKSRKPIKRTLAGMAALIAFSAIFNFIMLKVESTRYEPAGKLIEVDGHKMHIHAEGEGYPTVVMTCGSGTPSAYTDYSALQSKVSELTRVCIYERPGYGWSEHAATERSTEQIVEDLRELLIKAEEKAPYLFVAHSMGALEVLLYAHRYPDEVRGIILIDGTSPYKHIHYPQSSIPKPAVRLIRGLMHTGILRAVVEMRMVPLLNERLRHMPEDMRKIEKAMIYKNLLNNMVIEEGKPLKTSAEAMEGRLNLKALPLIILTAGESLRMLPGWENSQESLLKLSTNSKQVIIEGADHVSIHLKHSEEVLTHIRELIDVVKSVQE